MGAQFPAPLGGAPLRSFTGCGRVLVFAQFPAPLWGCPFRLGGRCGAFACGTILLARARCCGRGWAGISARRLRCSSVGPHVRRTERVGSRTENPDRPRPEEPADRAPTGARGTARKTRTGPHPKSDSNGAASRGAGNCAKPPSDGTGTKCVPPDGPGKRKRRRPAGNRETTERRRSNAVRPAQGDLGSASEGVTRWRPPKAGHSQGTPQGPAAYAGAPDRAARAARADQPAGPAAAAPPYS